MNLWSYIAKRILLMIPTLLGVIAITFAVIQFVPGGPVEQVLIELKKGKPAPVNLLVLVLLNTAVVKAWIVSALPKLRRCMDLINRQLNDFG